jgi:hypothetical protein
MRVEFSCLDYAPIITVQPIIDMFERLRPVRLGAAREDGHLRDLLQQRARWVKGVQPRQDHPTRTRKRAHIDTHTHTHTALLKFPTPALFPSISLAFSLSLSFSPLASQFLESTLKGIASNLVTLGKAGLHWSEVTVIVILDGKDKASNSMMSTCSTT